MANSVVMDIEFPFSLFHVVEYSKYFNLFPLSEEDSYIYINNENGYLKIEWYGSDRGGLDRLEPFLKWIFDVHDNAIVSMYFEYGDTIRYSQVNKVFSREENVRREPMEIEKFSKLKIF